MQFAVGSVGVAGVSSGNCKSRTEWRMDFAGLRAEQQDRSFLLQSARELQRFATREIVGDVETRRFYGFFAVRIFGPAFAFSRSWGFAN